MFPNPSLSAGGSEGVFLYMLDVFVFKCLPPRDQHGVRVVVRAYLQVGQIPLGDKRAGDVGAAPVELLGAVITDGTLRHIDVDAVGAQGQHGAGTKYRVEKALLFQVVVLERAALV